MLESKGILTERSERVILLALRYVADRIGLSSPQTLDFSTRLVVKAEVAALDGPAPERHPAFRELGPRHGIAAETWNEALREASLAEFRFPGSIEFVATEDAGVVLQTWTDFMDGSVPRVRALEQQLLQPEPWLESLLPPDFLRGLMGVSGASVGESAPARREAPKLEPSQPVMRFFGVPFLKGLGSAFTAIELCPFLRHLATIRDGVELEVANRVTLQPFDLGDLAEAHHIAFRPRQKGDDLVELAIAGPRPEIARLDLRDGSELPGLPLANVTSMAYSGDGRFVAAGSRQGRIRAWHLGSEGPNLVLEADLEDPIASLAFHPEDPTLYGTLASGAPLELELAPSLAASAVAALRERAPGVPFRQVATGRSGYLLYLAGADDHVYALDTVTAEVGVINPGVGPIAGLQVLPLSGYLCVHGPHAVYVAHPVGPGHQDHVALRCSFEEAIFAASELDRDAVLVFHDASPN